jgi:hypothetical protein
MAILKTDITDFSAIQPDKYPAAGMYILGIDTDGQLKKMDSTGTLEVIGAGDAPDATYEIIKELTEIPYERIVTDLPGASLISIAYFNGMYYACADNQNTMYKSSDCATWTSFNPTNTGTSFQYLTVYANKLIIGCNNAIAYSTDGENYTEVAIGNNNCLWWQFTTFGGYLYAVAKYGVPSNGNSIARSADGITWESVGTGNNTYEMKGIASNGSEIIAINNCDIYVSTDGSAWTKTSNMNTALPYGINNMVYGNGKYVIRCQGGPFSSGVYAIFTDYNDITSAVSPIQTYGSPVPHSSNPPIYFLNNKFYIPCDGHSGYMNVAVSDDALTWTVYQVWESTGGENVYALCYDGTNIIGITKNPFTIYPTGTAYTHQVYKYEEISDTLMVETYNNLIRNAASESGSYIAISNDGNKLTIQREIDIDCDIVRPYIVMPQFGTKTKSYSYKRVYERLWVYERNWNLSAQNVISLAGNGYMPSYDAVMQNDTARESTATGISSSWESNGGCCIANTSVVAGAKIKYICKMEFFKHDISK